MRRQLITDWKTGLPKIVEFPEDIADILTLQARRKRRYCPRCERQSNGL